MTLLKDFRDFLFKQNVLSLAVAVVIGAAVGKVVAAVVDDVVMPVLGLALPGGDWRTAQWNLTENAAIKYGDLIGKLLDLALIAFAVFVAVRWIARLEKKPAAAPTKSCPACLETIPEAARKCRACGEAQEPVPGGRPLQPVGGGRA